MKRILGKVRRSFRYGEKGFTLIELLIVVAILGILAAVLIPNVFGFLRTGNLAAANTEVATVKTAAAAYYAEKGFDADDSNQVFSGGFIEKAPKSLYNFDNVTYITGLGSDTTGWDDDPYNFVFYPADQLWKKQ
jgi:prepilin-type N-terminal cleavage/methylation domain-containing protein